MTIADTGLPGSPKTSVPPRTPNHVGLPGPQRDAPEALLDAELGERGLDVVVRADRHAAREDHDVGGLERLADRVARRAGVVGHVAREHHLGALALGERGRA